MRIAIDNRFMIPGTGVESLVQGLVREITTLTNQHEFIFIGKPSSKKTFLSRLKERMWEQVVLPFLLIQKKIGIFLAPANIGVPLLKVCSYVVIIHDLIPLILSDLYLPTWHERFLYWVFSKISASRSDVIVTDSNVSKKDIVRILKVTPEKIKGIYPGIDVHLKKMESPDTIAYFKKKWNNVDRYILSMCSLHPQRLSGYSDPRKNVSRVIEAFELLKKRNNVPHKLVIIGPANLNESCFLELPLTIKKDIVLTGYLSQSDLTLMYSAAELFVFPSLYEGFGLPVLEAMACGTPCICSDIDVFKELFGDAAAYVDPHDSEEIARIMLEVISHQELKEQLIERGFGRSKMFSLRTSAMNYLEVFESFKR